MATFAETSVDASCSTNLPRSLLTDSTCCAIALNEAVENNLISNGDYVLLAAFGSGFTWGSILIKWDLKH